MSGKENISRFIAHNRSLFFRETEKDSSSPVIMMELNGMHSAHIAYSYLGNVMADKYGAQIKAYTPRHPKSRARGLIAEVKAFLGFEPYSVYGSFGVNEFIRIKLDNKQKWRAKLLFKGLLPKIREKRDVENLRVDGVWIGDLIYDTYLMSFKKPTIDVNGDEFRRFLLESLELFVFWGDYLKNHNVCGINVSHCVYTLAIPLRIAVKQDIPVFQASATHLYRLSEDNLFAYNDFFHFPRLFAQLPESVQRKGLALAEHRIQKRFSGEVGVDMAYSTKSAFVASGHTRLLRHSTKKKVLIATHCFFDSPHSYGNNLFPDFYEWLDFLGQITECTDYDWYVKTHPDYLPGTMEIINDFIARYPKFTLLPSDASHHQIIAEGIDVALTTYGTIGFEYAALGVPVINASLNNPNIAYDFNIHAKDPEDYRRLLMNLDDLDFQIDKRQVYEYYFMRNIYNTENLFFENYERFLAEIGGYSAQFTPLAYEKWLTEWTPERHEEIVSAVHDFVDSGQFRMDYSFYGRECSVETLVGA